MSALRRTPLFDLHVARGGRMVDFAGWEMPVQYRSILEEHRAVRRAAGLFDVSHMGEVEVRGPGARAFLDSLLTNDVGRLAPGGVLYSPMCEPSGGVVDDLLAYQRGPDDYFLCVNASNIAKDVAWIRDRAATTAADVEIVDVSDAWALLAIQGPLAERLLQPLTGAKLGLIRPFQFAEATVAGVLCLASRTGYTGEDGFELYHAPADSVALAEALLAAGAPHGLELCGLGARDSLRLEAGYPLYGHELSAEISPLAAGLGWTVKLGKAADFIGRTALAAEKAAGSPRRVLHFRTGDRRIVRPDTPVCTSDGTVVGRVLSGTLSPILNEAIGSALVSTAFATSPLFVAIRGTEIPLQIVRPPLVPRAGT
jgi:aminomethyltransferase